MKSNEIAVRRPERDGVDTPSEDSLHALGREAAGKVEAIAFQGSEPRRRQILVETQRRGAR